MDVSLEKQLVELSRILQAEPESYIENHDPCTVNYVVTDYNIVKAKHALKAAAASIREIKIHKTTYHTSAGLMSPSPKEHLKTYEASRREKLGAQDVAVWCSKKDHSWLDMVALIKDALNFRFKVHLSVKVEDAQLAETMLRYLKPSSVAAMPGSSRAPIPSMERRLQQFATA